MHSSSRSTKISKAHHPPHQSQHIPSPTVGISCPSFPLPQISSATLTSATTHSTELTRRNTVTATPSSPSSSGHLPLLDFTSLLSTPSNQIKCTERQQIDDITSSVSSIRPYLYIGSQQSLQSLSSTTLPYPITHIISFTSAPISYHVHHKSKHKQKIVHVQFPIRDDVHQSINHLFQPVAYLIDQARKAQGAAALLCVQGISRSSTCALAYLILREGLTAEQALESGRLARPIIAPNTSFMNALIKLEHKVRQGLSTDHISIIKQVSTLSSSSTSVNINKYVGERNKYEHAAASVLTRPFVAVPINKNEHVKANDQVIVIEKKERRGVIVWFGSHSDRDAQLAGQRIGRMMVKQEISDDKHFPLHDFHAHNHVPSNLIVVLQGHNQHLDHLIANTLLPPNKSVF